jgi:hypothetical protein
MRSPKRRVFKQETGQWIVSRIWLLNLIRRRLKPVNPTCQNLC